MRLKIVHLWFVGITSFCPQPGVAFEQVPPSLHNTESSIITDSEGTSGLRTNPSIGLKENQSIEVKIIQKEEISRNYNCNNGEDNSCLPLQYVACSGRKRFYNEDMIRLNWYEAWEFCRLRGMTLASVDSKYEQHILETFLLETSTNYLKEYWTSGTDLGNEGIFYWMSSGKRFNFNGFTNWEHGEPNNYGGQENCVEIVLRSDRNGYKWNDRSCLSRGYSLCQYTK